MTASRSSPARNRSSSQLGWYPGYRSCASETKPDGCPLVMVAGQVLCTREGQECVYPICTADLREGSVLTITCSRSDAGADLAWRQTSKVPCSGYDAGT